MKTFFVLTILFCGSLCATQTFKFNGFTTSNLNLIQLNGAAPSKTPNSRDYLTLTNNSGNLFGSAFLKNGIQLSNSGSFSTFFGFSMTNPGQNGGADGITFAIVQSNIEGSTGCGIGYQCIRNSIGVEFDTYQNAKWATDCASCVGAADNFPHGAGYNRAGDNDNNHVGVNLNGDPASVVASRYPVSFKDGNLHYAWVDYNGATQVLEVRVAENIDRPQYAVISYKIDLVSIIGSSTVYAGFTSATGLLSEEHNIIVWSFTNDYSPFGLETACDAEIHDDPAIFGYNGQRFLFNGVPNTTFNIYNDDHGLVVNGKLSNEGLTTNGSMVRQLGIVTPGGHKIRVYSNATDDSKKNFTFIYDGVAMTVLKGTSKNIGNCTIAAFDRYGRFLIVTPIHKVYILDVTKTHKQNIKNTFLNVHVNFIPQANMKIGGVLGQTVSTSGTLDIGSSKFVTTDIFDASCTACGPYNARKYDECNNLMAVSKRSVHDQSLDAVRRDSTVGNPTCTIPTQ